jgi:hypothetical protein
MRLMGRPLLDDSGKSAFAVAFHFLLVSPAASNVRMKGLHMGRSRPPFGRDLQEHWLNSMTNEGRSRPKSGRGVCKKITCRYFLLKI